MRSKIRLLCPAEDLQALLSRIHYQSEAAGSDELKVMVQYGQCNHTVPQLLEGNVSVPSLDCIKEEIVIPIDVSETPYSGQYLHREFPWISWSSALGMILFIIFRGWMRQRDAAKRAQAQADAANTLQPEEAQEARWRELRDANGDRYYQNLQDGEVTWEMPEGENILFSPDDCEQEDDESTAPMTTTSAGSSVNSD